MNTWSASPLDVHMAIAARSQTAEGEDNTLRDADRLCGCCGAQQTHGARPRPCSVANMPFAGTPAVGSPGQTVAAFRTMCTLSGCRGCPVRYESHAVRAAMVMLTFCREAAVGEGHDGLPARLQHAVHLLEHLHRLREVVHRHRVRDDLQHRGNLSMCSSACRER